MAEVLHLTPRDIDALTAAEFDSAVEYLSERINR